MADKMTLEKFEEACEIVGKVTNKTGLMYSQCFSEQTGNKVFWFHYFVLDLNTYRI